MNCSSSSFNLKNYKFRFFCVNYLVSTRHAGPFIHEPDRYDTYQVLVFERKAY